MKKYNYLLFIKSAFLVLIISFNLLSYGQGHDCTSAQMMSINTVTKDVTINGPPGTPSLIVCSNVPNNMQEGWFIFVATTNYSAVTFLNLGDVTAYVYFYAGACGSLFYLDCMSVMPGNNIDLMNIQTTIGDVFYIRIVQVESGTVTGRLGVYSNTGTKAVLCRTDKSSYKSGTAYQDGSKVDDMIEAGDKNGNGVNEDYSVGYMKFNTANLPVSTSSIIFKGIEFGLTYKEKNLTTGQTERECITKLKNDSYDPVTQSGSQLYGRSTSFTKFYNDIGSDYIKDSTSIYLLNNSAIVNFAEKYTQSWWGICVPTEWNDAYNPGDYVDFYGWQSKYFPYIVVTYVDTICPGISFIVYDSNATCNTCGDGYAWLKVVGGTPPYYYTWYTSPLQTKDTAKGLNPGIYHVCVTDLYGCTTCDSVTINTGHCSAHFDLYPTSTPHVYNAVNKASGAMPLKYVWSWGDGTYDSTAYPTHTYSKAGYYKICLTITDNAGCKNTYCNSYYLLKSNDPIIEINVIPNTVGINIVPGSEFSVLCYPNPVDEMLNVECLMLNRGNVNIEIYDVMGRNQLGIRNEELGIKGENKIKIDVSGLRSGVYFLKFQVLSSKFQVEKVAKFVKM